MGEGDFGWTISPMRTDGEIGEIFLLAKNFQHYGIWICASEKTIDTLHSWLSILCTWTCVCVCVCVCAPRVKWPFNFSQFPPMPLIIWHSFRLTPPWHWNGTARLATYPSRLKSTTQWTSTAQIPTLTWTFATWRQIHFCRSIFWKCC